MHRRGDSSILGQKLGPYVVKDRLGQGGMGAVYLATDLSLDRKVALKVLLARHAGDEEFIARFQREARASAKLNHPNIVQIYTVDIESDPPYMAMEYIEGESLEGRIRRVGALPWHKALTVVSQVASALACAHAAGIIHRDIKPANILLDKQDRARVTDFGIAKIMGSQTNLTGTQHTVGSPCYMSPEQCGKGEVTQSSDIFSLGIMLFEMLTGKVPFTAESSLAVMKRITEEDLPPLDGQVDGIPPTVQHILNTLACRDPKFRYATANQVLEDLRAFQSGGALQNLQTLGLQRASQEPASASAANLTRSPTGPSPALKSSLVEELIEDAPRPVVVPRRTGMDLDVPWTGILVTGMVVFLAILGMLYAKGWHASPPGAPPNGAAEVPRNGPERDPRAGDRPLGPPPPGGARDGFQRPIPPPEGLRPRDGFGPPGGERPGGPRRGGQGPARPPQ